LEGKLTKLQRNTCRLQKLKRRT